MDRIPPQHDTMQDFSSFHAPPSTNTQGVTLPSMSSTFSSADYTQAPRRASAPVESSPPSSQRVRKRTKTGCLTCRKRRIKCGEERPICRNCLKSKRECEGYVPGMLFRDPLDGASSLHHHHHHHHHSAAGIYGYGGAGAQPIGAGVDVGASSRALGSTYQPIAPRPVGLTRPNPAVGAPAGATGLPPLATNFWGPLHSSSTSSPAQSLAGSSLGFTPISATAQYNSPLVAPTPATVPESGVQRYPSPFHRAHSAQPEDLHTYDPQPFIPSQFQQQQPQQSQQQQQQTLQQHQQPPSATQQFRNTHRYTPPLLSPRRAMMMRRPSDVWETLHRTTNESTSDEARALWLLGLSSTRDPLSSSAEGEGAETSTVTPTEEEEAEEEEEAHAFEASGSGGQYRW